eukprot:scaffold111477_cov32-Tisochrysis_lutea.AAC.2
MMPIISFAFFTAAAMDSEGSRLSRVCTCSSFCFKVSPFSPGAQDGLAPTWTPLPGSSEGDTCKPRPTLEDDAVAETSAVEWTDARASHVRDPRAIDCGEAVAAAARAGKPGGFSPGFLISSRVGCTAGSGGTSTMGSSAAEDAPSPEKPPPPCRQLPSTLEELLPTQRPVFAPQSVRPPPQLSAPLADLHPCNDRGRSSSGVAATERTPKLLPISCCSDSVSARDARSSASAAATSPPTAKSAAAARFLGKPSPVSIASARRASSEPSW